MLLLPFQLLVVIWCQFEALSLLRDQIVRDKALYFHCVIEVAKSVPLGFVGFALPSLSRV